MASVSSTLVSGWARRLGRVYVVGPLPQHLGHLVAQLQGGLVLWGTRLDRVEPFGGKRESITCVGKVAALTDFLGVGGLTLSHLARIGSAGVLRVPDWGSFGGHVLRSLQL